jgi:hypothetical protein
MPAFVRFEKQNVQRSDHYTLQGQAQGDAIYSEPVTTNHSLHRNSS